MFIKVIILFTFVQLSFQRNKRCEEFADLGFQCVPLHQCKNGNVEPRGSGVKIVNLRTIGREDEAIGSKCKNILDVCCQNTIEEHTDYKDRQQGERAADTSSESTSFPGCGERNTTGPGVLGFGDLAEEKVGSASLGEWPNVCMIIEMEPEFIPNFQAGASLISRSAAITGAKKVEDQEREPRNLVLRCGFITVSSRDYVEYKITRIEMHPEFRSSSGHNNFAVLFIKPEVQLNSVVYPACLPPPNLAYNAADMDCYSQGWGKESFNSGEYSQVLKSVRLPLVEHGECQDRLRTSRLTKEFDLHESFVCAGGVMDEDTCIGDGGGPLMCRQRSSQIYLQVGITSWGIGCGNKFPGVYADISKAACWIDKVVSCSETAGATSVFGYTTCPEALPYSC